jgi:hypothetical protein
MSDHDWLGIAVAFVLGILPTAYFYLKSKRKVHISYSIDKTQLLGGERGVLPGEVSILYKDMKISDLVKFNAIFWHSGNASISHSDIMDPIMISVSDTSTLLKASVLKSSRPENGVALYAVDDAHKIRVDFQYFEPQQGFNLELLLTDAITDEPMPSGVILGMPGGFRKFDEKTRRRIASVIMWLGNIVIFGGFILTLKVLNVNESDRYFGLVIGIPAVLSTLLLGFGASWPQGIFRRQGIPPDLHT